MTDINMSQEKTRSMMAEALARLRSASSEYFQLLEKSLVSSPLLVADQAKQFCEFMQHNVSVTFDLGDKLVQARDLQDALQLQAEFFQRQMQSLTEQARAMSESAVKAATGAFTRKS